ncbi:hypothetical protein PMAYCL1PPCAC_14081, partial [Pristionchus mayeri]
FNSAVSRRMTEYREIFGAKNGMLFSEEPLEPIFCKPKLLPLKTVTMEKMEKMQKDAIEKLKVLEKPEYEAEESEDKPVEIVAGGTE